MRPFEEREFETWIGGVGQLYADKTAPAFYAGYRAALAPRVTADRAELAALKAEIERLKEGIQRYMADDPPCDWDCATLDAYQHGACDCGVQAFVDSAALRTPDREVTDG